MKKTGTFKLFIKSLKEILFIVIGILIAFQFEDFNSKRLERIREKEILLEVYRNLHDDLKEINSNMEILLTIQNSNALIIDYLRGTGSNIDRSRNALNIIGNGVFLLRKKWGTMNFSMKGLI